MAAERDHQAGNTTDVQPADRITLDEIVVNREGLLPPPTPSLPLIGWWAFRMLVFFIGVAYVVMAWFAWSTYPSLSDFINMDSTGSTRVTVPRGPPASTTVVLDPTVPTQNNPFSLWRQARAEWLAQIKELGQLFILTPLLPLLSAVAGYIFGREQRTTLEE